MRIFRKVAGTRGPSIGGLMTLAAFLLFLIVGTQWIGMARETQEAQRSKARNNANLIARGKYIEKKSPPAVTATRLAARTANPTAQSGGAPVFFQPAKPVP